MKSRKNYSGYAVLFGILLCLTLCRVAVWGMTTEGVEPVDADFSENVFRSLTGAFMPLISMSGSPFLTLAILSGIGYFLNAGMLDPQVFGEAISLSIMKLPISNLFTFVILTLVTALKLILGLIGATNLLSDAILGKIEKSVGSISAVVLTFLWVMSRLQGRETGATAGTDIRQTLLSVVISVAVSGVAYLLYLVMRTTVSALDSLTLLFATIPGATAAFTVAKNVTVFVYTWLTLTNPKISMAIGLVFFAIACLLFGRAKRIERYYRTIYLKPLMRKFLGRARSEPLLPVRLPRAVAEEFGDVEVCLEVFSMNRLERIRKKQRCYFVRSGQRNYLIRKPWFGKRIRIEITEPLYLEVCFRFLRIFSHEEYSPKQRRFMLVFSGEYKGRADELIAGAGMIDYREILRERKRMRNEQFEHKKQMWMNKIPSVFTKKLPDTE